MIGNVTFNNYRFFDDNQSLSLFPDLRIKKLLSNSISIDNKNVLKSSAIYGSNNSGKSNIICIFDLIKRVLLGKDVSFNSKILRDGPIIDISITFNNNDGEGWFKYSFSFDELKKSYIKESFSSITYYDDGAPFEKIIFEKDIDNLILSINGADKSNLIDVVSSAKPLLYTLNLEQGSYKELSIYLNKLKTLSDSIIVFKMFNIPIENTISTLKGSEESKKKFILSFVKNADLTISDFKYNEKILLNYEKPKNVDEKALKDLAEFEETLHLSTKYKKNYVPSILFDSSGTKKIEALAAYIYDAIYEGKTLIIDELDNGLHYKLTRAIVSAFNNIINKTGQLIFTAHDLLLVSNNNLMRKDQIYFVSRGNTKAELIWMKDKSVAEGGLRDMDVLIKRYNHGDFVKVPSPSFIDTIFEIEKKDI